MDLNKRTILSGIGAVAMGGATVFGSGAFTQVEADRTFNVTVAGSDTESQLVIEDIGRESTAITTNEDDGTFTIDASGAQPGAVTTFGEFATTADATTLEQGTFAVRNANETGEPIDLTLQLGLDGSSEAVVTLAAAVDPANDTIQTTDTTTGIDGGESISLVDIPSTNAESTSDGEAEVECGLVIDTTAGGVGETLNLTFAVKAVRSAVTDEPV